MMLSGRIASHGESNESALSWVPTDPNNVTLTGTLFLMAGRRDILALGIRITRE